MTRDEIRELARQAITNTPGGRGYDERLEDNVTKFALRFARRCADIAKCHDESTMSGGETAVRISLTIAREFGLTEDK